MAALPRLNIERYRDIGAYLHDVRLQQKRDINTIAEELNIRAVHLQAIERSNMEALPGMAYARGFIVSYAEELGLHGETVWARYQKMQHIADEAPLYIPHAESQHDLPNKTVHHVSLVMLSIAGLLWFQSLPETPESLVDMSVLDAPKDVAPETEDIAPAETLEEVNAAAVIPQASAITKPHDCIPTIASPCADTTQANASESLLAPAPQAQ